MLALKRKREAQARAAAAAAGSGLSSAKSLGMASSSTGTGAAAAGGKKKRSAAEIRIQKDLALVETEDAAIVFPDPNDLTEFTLEVSPKRGPYGGGVFDFSFQVLPNYPYSPPRVVCNTKIYHPNVAFYDGKVCLGMRDWWRPVHDVSTVIHGLVDMFYEPAVDISVNEQAASLLKENQEQFNRVVMWTRRRSNDKKAINQTTGHSILDILPPEMLRIATDFLDEESLLKFFISALGSVPHQYIYTTMARKLVRERFANLNRLLRHPPTLSQQRRNRTPLSIPPAVTEFVHGYSNEIEEQDEANHVAGVLSVAGDDPAALEDENAGEIEAIMDLQRIVQVIRCLSGRLAVLHYFRDTVAKATKQDVLWPVWCGKFELQTGNNGSASPATLISTPIWYPSLIRKCKRAFSNEYCAGRAMLHGFDLMRRFERGFSFLLARVTGMSSKDVRQLSEIDGRRLMNRAGSTGDGYNRMAVVRADRARELLHRLRTFRALPPGGALPPAGGALPPAGGALPPAGVLPPAGGVLPPAGGVLPPGGALPPGIARPPGGARGFFFDFDDHPFARPHRMPLAQYTRVLEGEGNGELYCLWEDSLEGDGDGYVSYDEFTDLTMELLTTQKSILLLSNLPEYWHAGEWEEPPTMLWRRS